MGYLFRFLGLWGMFGFGGGLVCLRSFDLILIVLVVIVAWFVVYF